jgi:ABC-type uncharacterized transport system auxiliary subunit
MIQRRQLLNNMFLAGASAFVLTGCGKDLIGPPEASPIYVVKPVFPAGAGGGTKVPWALSILRPDVSSALDSERIALFQPDGTMDFYAKATYPDRLSPIVQHAIMDLKRRAGSMRWRPRKQRCMPTITCPSRSRTSRPITALRTVFRA